MALSSGECRKPSSAHQLHNVIDGVAPDHCFAMEMTTGMTCLVAI